MDAGGQLSAAAFPQAEAIAAVQDTHFPTPSTDEDSDDLYSDVNLGLGFLPLPPPSPASPTSTPKTPSPGPSIPSPSPPPRGTSAPNSQPEPEPQRKPTPQHQLPPPPPPPAPKPTPRHQPQQRSSSGGNTSPPTTALYIGELPWWTTDAEVEAALAPHGALHGLFFFADNLTGKSRGFCRADFLHPAAAASAAAALHGRAFHGRHCVASLSSPPALHRPDADFHARAPNPTRVRGWNASNVTTARGRGNVGPLLGDRPALAPLPGPMAPRPRVPPFGGMTGGGVGYGRFPSMGQCNAGMGTAGMMPSVVALAPHVNPAFLAARGMAMGGPGVWHDQGMAGVLWGGQHPWNFRGCEMSLRQLRPPPQHHQVQQQYRYGDYGKERVKGREKPGSRNEERDIGNVRGYPERRQCGRDGGDWSRDHDREERGRYREHVLGKERNWERHCSGRDRCGGDTRRYQEYTERDDYERRGRVRSRSQSSDSDDDDHPGRRR